jgi:hypothetical protein
MIIMINAALMYREKYGFSVIPLTYFPPTKDEKKGKKVPLIKTWKGFQKELPSPEQINLWWTQWPDAMIGVITGKLSGICTIDVDEEIGFEVIQEVVPDSLLMPTYKTPSGGCQMIFKMPDINLRSAVRNLPGCDLRAEAGIALLPPSHNVVGKYEWMPDLSINGNEIPPLPIAYINKINIKQYKENVTITNSEVTGVTTSNISFSQGSRNDSLFSVANSLAKGGMQRNNALYVIESIAKKCEPPLDDREILTIVDSAFQRNLGRSRNIYQELLAWVRVTTGNFHVTSSYNELQVVTKDEKAAARMAYHRMVVDGILEKIGKRDGIYCLKESVADDIDFVNADITPFHVKWPLGVHKKVEIYQKSIVIIAGESNAGKTAYCLNVAKDNRDEHDVLYLLSEGDPAELKIRLLKFKEPLSAWQKVKFKNIRGGNLAKLINPSGFNIIDYLELYKDFYEVGGVIDEIYQRLTTGIAVIAIQKPEGRDLGVGGRGTLDKARLYLSIEPGKIKIVKGKIWKDEFENPNGLYCTWKLGGGCYFKRDNPDMWEREVKDTKQWKK